MQAANLEKDCNSFTVCVAIGMFVLGVKGITFPSFFFSGTGIMIDQSIKLKMSKKASFPRYSFNICGCRLLLTDSLSIAVSRDKIKRRTGSKHKYDIILIDINNLTKPDIFTKMCSRSTIFHFRWCLHKSIN